MKAIDNWNDVKETGGEIEVLPVGGYVCRIEMCTEKPNKNGGTHLEIMFDVVEGDYRGFFMEDWKSQQREDKFWRGIIRQNVPNENSPKYDKQKGFFKKFTNAVEASNPDYHWDWNEGGLKGKLIGVIFGEVERTSSRGNRYITTQADSVTSVENIRNEKYRIPAPKMLSVPTAATIAVDVSVDDGDLPF